MPPREKTNEWTRGIFGCMTNTSLCLDTCLCFPCQQSRQCMASADPPQPQTFSCIHCICADSLPLLYTCMIRKRVVENYGIDEGILTTVCCGCLCPLCSACQTSLELSVNQSWSGGTACMSEPVSRASIN